MRDHHTILGSCAYWHAFCKISGNSGFIFCPTPALLVAFLHTERLIQELLSCAGIGCSISLSCAVLLSWHCCLQAKETTRCLACPSRTRHRRPTLWCRHPAHLPRAHPRPTSAPLARPPAAAPPATAPTATAPIATAHTVTAHTTTRLAATAHRRTATVRPRTVALQATALPAARHLQADCSLMGISVGLYAEGFSAPAGEL